MKVFTIAYLVASLIVASNILFHWDEMTKHLTPTKWKYDLDDILALVIICCFVIFTPGVNFLAAYYIVKNYMDGRKAKPRLK